MPLPLAESAPSPVGGTAGTGEGSAPNPRRVTTRDRWLLLGIVAVGVALRVAWSVYAARPPVGLQDPALYGVFAEQIAAGNGYRLPDGQPTAYYPVGYPAVLGAVFWLADSTPLPGGRPGLVAGLNVVMAAASLVFVFEVARRAFDRRVGLLAAAWLAVFPNLVFHTAVALTETLFNTIALAAVLVAVAWDWRPRRIGPLAAFGALAGLAALVRPPSLLFVPMLALAGRWGAGWAWRDAGRAALVAGAAAAAVIAPWTIRNLVVMEAPVVIATNTGDNLCIGNNPEATGAFQLPDCLDGYEHLKRPEYELQRDAGARRAALEHIREHPADQLRLVPLRLYHTFKQDTDGLFAAESYGRDAFIPGGTRRLLEVLANVTFFTTLALALLATPLVLAGRRPARLFLALGALSLAATPLVFFGDPRFHVPVVPYLAVAAAAGVVAGLDRLRVRSRSSLASPP